MRYKVTLGDSVLSRYGNQIAALGDEQAHVAFARALNHEGKKGYTQVKKALVRQTGIKYGMINKAVRELRASPGHLSYSLEAKAGETNLRLFGAVQRKSGVSAAPWNVRRVYRSSDGLRGSFINSKSGLVMIRTTGAHYPLRSLFGPNIAREMLKDESLASWDVVPITLAARIGHELARMLPG